MAAASRRPFLVALAGLCAASLLLGGCAKPAAPTTTFGINFDAAHARQFVPGQATKTQVVAELGNPKSSDSFSAQRDLSGRVLAQPVAIDRLTYYFSDRSATAAKPGMLAYRSAVFLFAGESLIDATHRSSFPNEAVDFDEAKVRSIVRGRTRQADVSRMFGAPSGTALYPSARDPGGSAWTYDALAFDKQTQQLRTKRLVVFFNRAKVVTHVELDVSEG
jgi:outer membrane protein assembly factor BamE (lipoprotein component of BamABCDE complex)